MLLSVIVFYQDLIITQDNLSDPVFGDFYFVGHFVQLGSIIIIIIIIIIAFICRILQASPVLVKGGR